jgi:hypothetical protein
LQSQEPQDEDEEILDDSEDGNYALIFSYLKFFIRVEPYIIFIYINILEEDVENQENNMKKEVNKKYVSFIDACFGGRLVSVIVCDVCKNVSSNNYYVRLYLNGF